MYLNLYQRCVKALLDEFGPMYQRQLEALVRRKVNDYFRDLDGYIEQMCQFGDYERLELSDEILISPANTAPDGDMLRCIEVMLGFADELVAFFAGTAPVKLRFFVRTAEREKEICVVPVHRECEKSAAAFVDGTEGGETVILLPDAKEQIPIIKTAHPCKFVIVNGRDVTFYTKNQEQEE